MYEEDSTLRVAVRPLLPKRHVARLRAAWCFSVPWTIMDM